MTKIEQALSISEKLLEGIELETISTSSALLQCLRIARLTSDTDATIWLQYEYGGYPRNKKGEIDSKLWNIAYDNGRGCTNKDNERVIFTETAASLEAIIESRKKAIANFTTQGVSVSGEQGFLSMQKLTDTVSRSTSALLKAVVAEEENLAKLRGAYYSYSLRKNIELSFGNVATDIFTGYRQNVDNYFSELSSETILKLQAIEDKINSDNPEMYSQALTTCRRLFENTATELFERHFPQYKETLYRTKSGKEIDVSGDHYRNKISAVIEKLQDKSLTKTLVGSSVLYTLDWIETLTSLQSKGVHANITKQDAEKCIIHTYICLGDILGLKN